MFEKVPEDFLGFQVHCVRFLWEIQHFGGICQVYMLDAAKKSREFVGFSWIFEKILEDFVGFRVHRVRFS